MQRKAILALGTVATAAALALAGCSASGTPAGDGTPKDPDSLVLALVPSQDQNTLVDTAKPLTDMLTQALGIPVTGVVSKDYGAAVEAMGADQAQIGFLPSLQLWQASDKYGAKVVLQTNRNGAISYAAQFMTNDPDKYCDDTPVADAKGNLFCNGTASGTGPAGLDAIKKITAGTKVAELGAGSPAGYIYPILALKNAGVDTDSLAAVPVTGNDTSVLAVYNGDAEVGFSFWDARTIITDKPDVGQKVVTFALTDMIPNDGVAVSGKLSTELQDKITKALEDYSNTDEGSKELQAIYSITKLSPADPSSLDVVADAASKLGLQ